MKVVKMHLAPCLQLAALLLMIFWTLAWKKQKWSHRHLNEGIAAVLIEESRASKTPIGWFFFGAFLGEFALFLENIGRMNFAS